MFYRYIYGLSIILDAVIWPNTKHAKLTRHSTITKTQIRNQIVLNTSTSLEKIFILTSALSRWQIMNYGLYEIFKM